MNVKRLPKEVFQRYSFRLAELLGHVPDPRKRPGD